MSDEIVINITPDPSINISAVDSNEEIALNPLTLNQGLINHSVTHQSGGSDELAHNLLGGLQGGSGNQFYHLTSGEYSNLVTGSVVRPNETGNFITNNQTGQFYANSNPSGFITGIYNLVYTTGDQTISGIKRFRNNLVLESPSNQLQLRTGSAGNTIFITTPAISANRTYTIPDIGSSAAFVLTQGPQTIGGEKTFTNNIVGSGTNNLFINEEGDSPHSLLTQQQLMLNGHKFRQGVCVNTKKVGLMPETVAEQFQVLGMKASIGNNISQAAAAYTLDGLFCSDVSVTTLPINNEIDAYFHGVAMQFLPNVNWKARINFGVPYSKSIAYANQPPTNTTQQWGVEFYYNGTNFVGRLYFFYDPPIIYGTPFTLPLYTGASHLAWEGFVYSIRVRQVVVSANRLRLEFYMNTSASNSGGTQLSKTTPLATLLTPVITTPNFRFDGKHINFEVASNGAGITPSGQIRMQSTNMYCQFK